jgi:hypothetical protein
MPDMAPTTENESISWRTLFAFKSHFLSAARILLLITVADIGVSLALSTAMPPQVFLSWYLQDNYEQVIDDFYKHQLDLIPDAAAGWRNRPHVSKTRWVTGPHGERVNGEAQPAPQQPTDPIRVLMLGNSMINGGLHIGNDQTLSHYVEDARIRALNLGSMGYSIDQALLDYQERLSKLGADVVVVGLTNDAHAVTNMFVPFRLPQERYMPFLKPRFTLDGPELRRENYAALSKDGKADPAHLIEYLKERDESFWRFESFMHFGLMPLSRSIHKLYLTMRSSVFGLEDYKQGLNLETRIISEFRQATEANGAKLLFVVFVDPETDSQRFYKRFLPDHNGMYLSMLSQTGADVLVVSRLLDATGRDKSGFYYADSIHLTPEANQIVAEAIREKIYELVR